MPIGNMKLSSQNQHFIPRSYLSEFSSKREGWFHELNILTKNIREIHVNNACRIKDFYDINDEKILSRYKLDNPRHLEYSFSYENSLGKILSKIRTRQPYLDRNELQTIIEAYVSMKHRTPYFRKQLANNELLEPIIDTTVENFKLENQNLIKAYNFNYDEFAIEFKNKILNDSERAKNHHLLGLVESSKNQNTPVKEALIKIFSMNIFIIEAPDNEYFLVSDNPGYSLDDNRMFNTNYGKFDKIHFPINSKQMILFDGFNLSNLINPLIRLKYITVGTSFISEVQRLTRLIADERLFCENRDYLVRLRELL